MKRIIFVCLFSLGGCVVSSSTHIYSSQTSVVRSDIQSTNNQEEHTTQVQPVTPKVASKPSVSTGNCPDFILPAAMSAPELPVLIDPSITKMAELDKVLAEHIHKLQQHIKAERATIEEAYRRYREACSG